MSFEKFKNKPKYYRDPNDPSRRLKRKLCTFAKTGKCNRKYSCIECRKGYWKPNKHTQ